MKCFLLILIVQKPNLKIYFSIWIVSAILKLQSFPTFSFLKGLYLLDLPSSWLNFFLLVWVCHLFLYSPQYKLPHRGSHSPEKEKRALKNYMHLTPQRFLLNFLSGQGIKTVNEASKLLFIQYEHMKQNRNTRSYKMVPDKGLLRETKKHCQEHSDYFPLLASLTG